MVVIAPRIPRLTERGPPIHGSPQSGVVPFLRCGSGFRTLFRVGGIRALDHDVLLALLADEALVGQVRSEPVQVVRAAHAHLVGGLADGDALGTGVLDHLKELGGTVTARRTFSGSSGLTRA